jgi:hypothetical protein
MDPEALLPTFTRSAICPYPQPHQSSLCPSSHILKIHFNIIVQYTPGSSKWSLSLRSSHQIPVCPYTLAIRTTCPAHLIHLDLTRSADHKAPRYVCFSTTLLQVLTVRWLCFFYQHVYASTLICVKISAVTKSAHSFICSNGNVTLRQVRIWTLSNQNLLFYYDWMTMSVGGLLFIS